MKDLLCDSEQQCYWRKSKFVRLIRADVVQGRMVIKLRETSDRSAEWSRWCMEIKKMNEPFRTSRGSTVRDGRSCLKQGCKQGMVQVLHNRQHL